MLHFSDVVEDVLWMWVVCGWSSSQITEQEDLLLSSPVHHLTYFPSLPRIFVCSNTHCVYSVTLNLLYICSWSRLTTPWPPGPRPPPGRRTLNYRGCWGCPHPRTSHLLLLHLTRKLLNLPLLHQLYLRALLLLLSQILTAVFVSFVIPFSVL